MAKSRLKSTKVLILCTKAPIKNGAVGRHQVGRPKRYVLQAGRGHKKQSTFQSFPTLLCRVAKFNIGKIDWKPHIPWVSNE